MRFATYNDDDDGNLAFFQISFGNNIKYWINSCMYENQQKQFNNLPSENKKIWKIAKTSNTLSVWCNDVLVLDKYNFQDSGRQNCIDNWRGDKVDGIIFNDEDTASEKYSPVSYRGKHSKSRLLIGQFIYD